MANQLSAINHIVVLMLENRSFDHMLGLLYSASGNVSPAGQPFDGLTGKESNPGTDGSPVVVFPIAPADANAYFMPGAAKAMLPPTLSSSAAPRLLSRLWQPTTAS